MGQTSVDGPLSASVDTLPYIHVCTVHVQICTVHVHVLICTARICQGGDNNAGLIVTKLKLSVITKAVAALRIVSTEPPGSEVASH